MHLYVNRGALARWPQNRNRTQGCWPMNHLAEGDALVALTRQGICTPAALRLASPRRRRWWTAVLGLADRPVDHHLHQLTSIQFFALVRHQTKRVIDDSSRTIMNMDMDSEFLWS